MLGDLRGFQHEVGHVSAAESATHQRGIHLDLVFRQFTDVGDDVERPLRALRGNPGFGAIRADMNRTVHRLHGGVRGEREFVGGFDFFGGSSNRSVGVSIIAKDFARFCGVVEHLLVEGRRGFVNVGSLVPGNL